MDKALLRKIFFEKRKGLSRSNYWILMDQIMDQVKQMNWSNYKVVHIFLPIKKHLEVDTFSILEYFKNNIPQLKIIIPRTNFETFEMESVLYDHEHTILVRNKYDIPEPLKGKIIPNNQIDLVLLPLLAFDKQGNRVGYGKGFYDRFLTQCRSDVKKVGISLFDPVEEISDTNQFDNKLDLCICPDKVWVFN